MSEQTIERTNVSTLIKKVDSATFNGWTLDFAHESTGPGEPPTQISVNGSKEGGLRLDGQYNNGSWYIRFHGVLNDAEVSAAIADAVQAIIDEYTEEVEQ